MSIVIGFLDAQGLAKLAQTCKAGHAIVYRTSLWTEWRVNPGTEYLYFNVWDIPATARHHGEPNRLCFLEWANLRRSRPDGTLPRRIAFQTDPAKYYELLHAHWIKLGRPCVHVHHHKWVDVFKGVAFLKDKTSLNRMYYRVVDSEPCMTNSYYDWMRQRLRLCPGTVWSVPATATATTTAAADPLLALEQQINQAEKDRYAYLFELRRTTLDKWINCMDRLAIRGKTLFDKNDRDYKKDPYKMLDAVTLSFVP